MNCNPVAICAFAAILVAVSAGTAVAADESAPSAVNMLFNGGFELDYHNNHAEGHAMGFMGDWSFNSSDLKPDYWKLDGTWKYSDAARSGRRSLFLKGDAAASRSVLKAASNGRPMYGPRTINWDLRWSSISIEPIPYDKPARLARTVTLSLWYKSANLGGENKLSVGVKSCNVPKIDSTTEPAANWKRFDVTLTRAEIEKAHADGTADGGVQSDIVLMIRTGGDAEVHIDDVSLSEDLADDVNLAVNGSFERVVGQSDAPASWLAPKKYDFYTPQYYKWTSWNHCFSPIRGTATTTDLVAHSGQRSLLMQLFPGDEMFVEGAPVILNQQSKEIVEIGAYVLLDRVKWIDIRAVDQDRKEVPCVDAFSGGWLVPRDNSQWYPSVSPEWVYVRKTFFGNAPLKSIRPRLCARGFNGDTRDDAGFRPHVNQTGLAFWDDVRVSEVTSTADELKARGVVIPEQKPERVDGLVIGGLDLGERLFGENIATVVLVSPTGANLDAEVSLRVMPRAEESSEVARRGFAKRSSPGQPPKERAATTVRVAVPAGKSVPVRLPYRLDYADMRGSWKEQGRMRLELAAHPVTLPQSGRGGTTGGRSRAVELAYNTWPVIVDVDFYRHLPTPDENPQTVAINLGVAEGTLLRTKSVTIEIRRRRDDKVIDTIEIAGLAKALARTQDDFADLSRQVWENPSPVQGADRKNLLGLRLDLSKVPVHPQNHPVRDHYLKIRGLDAARVVLFEDSSQLFGRVEPNREVLPKITRTEVRPDGAILINGQPVFLMGVGHYVLDASLNKTFGFNSMLGTDTPEVARKIWKEANLYSLQIKIDAANASEASLKDLVADGSLDGAVTLSQNWGLGAAFETPDSVARHRFFTRQCNTAAKRVTNFGGGGAFSVYTIEKMFDAYDTFGMDLEPLGPPRGGYELAPALRKGKAWFNLSTVFNSTPYDLFRFDQYAAIIQGARGFTVYNGLGDPSLYRGITGEIRHLSPAIFSADHGDSRTSSDRDISWMQRRVGDTTTIIAVSKPAVEIGKWRRRNDASAPDGQAHTGISEFTPLPTPDGLYLHAFREGKPVLIQPGDKFVQHVWLNPQHAPNAIAWGIRGDAKWDYNVHYGQPFDFAKWHNEWINFWLGGELLSGTWQIGATYTDLVRTWFADHVCNESSFRTKGELPAPGQWTRLEASAEELGIVGKQVDGFMFIARDGEAWWAHSAILRGDREFVLCDSSVIPHHADLKQVRFNVPWASDGTRVKVLFEERDLEVQGGGFADDFQGVDMYQTIRGGTVGDAIGWFPRGTPVKAQTLGYLTPSNPVQVHIYEITPGKK